MTEYCPPVLKSLNSSCPLEGRGFSGPAHEAAPTSTPLLPFLSQEWVSDSVVVFPSGLPRSFCSCCKNPEQRNLREAERRRPSRHLPDSPWRPRWACSVDRAASVLGVGSLGASAARSSGEGKMDPFTNGE